MECHNFETSFKEGEKGEREFAAFHPETLEWLQQPHRPDFRVTKTGDYLELKTDSFDADRTPNFFFERYSDLEKKTDGGPWQSLAKNCRWFVYYFSTNKICFIFETQKLVEKLEILIDFDDYCDIVNKKWITRGYKVARESVKDIYVAKTLK